MKQNSHWPLSVLGGATSLLNLALPLLLVRLLPAEEVGKYKVFFLYMVMIPWFCMTAGVTSGLSHWVGYEAKKGPFFKASYQLLLAITLIFAVIGSLGGFAAVKTGALDWKHADLVFFMIGACASLSHQFFEEAVISQGGVWRGALFSSGFEFLKNMALLAASYYGRAASPIFMAYAGVLLLKALLGAVLSFKQGWLTSKRQDWQTVYIPLLKYAAPVSLSAALYLINSFVDQLLLSRLLGGAEFAVYTMGCMLIPPLMIFEQSVNRVLIPEMSRAFAKEDPEQARVLYLNAQAELGWIMIPAAVGLFVFAKPIVTLLFTERFIEAVPIFRINAFTYLFTIVPMDAIARARGDAAWILRNLATFSAIALGLTLLGHRTLGPAGAIAGATLVHGLMRVAVWVRVHHTLGWQYLDLAPWKAWGKWMSASLGLGFAAWVSRGLFGGETLLWAFIAGPLIISVYFVWSFEAHTGRSLIDLIWSLRSRLMKRS